MHAGTEIKVGGQQISKSAPTKIQSQSSQFSKGALGAGLHSSSRASTEAKVASGKKVFRAEHVDYSRAKSPILISERKKFQKPGVKVECAKSCCADQDGSNSPEQTRRRENSLNAGRRLLKLANDHDYGSKPLEMAYIFF
ncbi:MAG: hypothetical protein GY820_42075 [Gammaproteobacteria bacterium]|nr:hypothetical protein [Gammaproteobacteria bacterium]